MKFIKIHKLNEGLFNTKAQMQAKLAKDDAMSDEEQVAELGKQAVVMALKKLLMGFIYQTDVVKHAIYQYVFIGDMRRVQGTYPYCEYSLSMPDWDLNYYNSGIESYDVFDRFSNFTNSSDSNLLKFIATNLDIKLNADTIDIEIDGEFAYVQTSDSQEGTATYNIVPQISACNMVYSKTSTDKARDILNRAFKYSLKDYIEAAEFNRKARNNNYKESELEFLMNLINEKEIHINKIAFFKNIHLGNNVFQIESILKKTPISVSITQNELSSQMYGIVNIPEQRPDKYCFAFLSNGIETREHSTDVCNPGNANIDYFYADSLKRNTGGLNDLFDIEQVDTNGGIGIMYNMPCVYSFSDRLKQMIKDYLLDENFNIDDWPPERKYDKLDERMDFLVFKEWFTKDNINLALAFTIRFPCTSKNSILYVHPLARQSMQSLKVGDADSTYFPVSTAGISVKLYGTVMTEGEISIQNIERILERGRVFTYTAGNISSVVFQGTMLHYILCQTSIFDSNPVIRALYEKEIRDAVKQAGIQILNAEK